MSGYVLGVRSGVAFGLRTQLHYFLVVWYLTTVTYNYFLVVNVNSCNIELYGN